MSTTRRPAGGNILSMFSALRLELAAIDAAVDQVRAALRDRDAELALLDATDVADTLQILTLRAASQRDRKHLAALTAERDEVKAMFAERLAVLARH
jgi:hypothetical protein